MKSSTSCTKGMKPRQYIKVDRIIRIKEFDHLQVEDNKVEGSTAITKHKDVSIHSE